MVQILCVKLSVSMAICVKLSISMLTLLYGNYELDVLDVRFNRSSGLCFTLGSTKSITK